MDNNTVDIEYYDLLGNELHLKICPGDLQIVCNVLYDYCNMISEMLADPPDGVDENTIQIWKSRYEYYLQRVQKIRGKIENEIGYSTEKAIKKCNKKKGKKDDDIGEDALVLAMKKHLSKEENSNKNLKTEETVQNQKRCIDVEQISLFDLESG